MTNRFPLLLTLEKAERVPRVLISVKRRCVQYINHRHGRTGALWDSRCQSSLVHADADLLCCRRCIELNPIGAEMHADPADDRCSNYRADAFGAPDQRLA